MRTQLETLLKLTALLCCIPTFLLANSEIGASNKIPYLEEGLLMNDTLDNPSGCGLGLAIPDDNCTGLHEFPVRVTGVSGTILGVDVILRELRLTIAHDWDNDLDIFLISPSGEVVTISTDNGDAGNNYGDPSDSTCQGVTTFIAHSTSNACNALPVVEGAAPFIGDFLPEEDFSNFNDGITNPNGIWTLKICDDAEINYGTLEFVELVFAPIICETPTTVSFSQIDSNSVLIDWTPGSDCLNTTTLIEYGLAGFSPNTDGTPGGGTLIFTGCPPFTLNNLESSTAYDVYIRELCGGLNFSNNSCLATFSTFCSPPPISLLENFNDKDICGTSCGTPCPIFGSWTNVAEDNFDWTVHTGATISSLTGPTDDVTGGGNYIYTETSGSCKNGKEAILLSNCINIKASPDSCDMSFYYHLFGFQIGELRLEITVDGGQNWDTIWREFGNHGDQWLFKYINLSPYDGQVAQLRFVSKSGTGPRGDMGLDHIAFYGSQTFGNPSFVFYADMDGDGFGDSNNTISNCGGYIPIGFVTNNGDCDDSNGMVNPGFSAVEIPCNNIDENCNGMDDDSFLSAPSAQSISVCSGAVAMLEATPGFNGIISWYDAATGGNLLTVGETLIINDLPLNNSTNSVTYTYFAEERTSNGCTSITRTAVTIEVQPLPNINTTDSVFICAGVDFDLSLINVIDANATNGTFTYFTAPPFEDGNEISSIVNPTETTTYFIRSTTFGQCSDTTTITLNIIPTPMPAILGDTDFCQGTTQTLTVLDEGDGVVPLAFQWNTGDETPFTNVASSSIVGGIDTYSVTITGGNGCTGVDEIDLETITSITSVSPSIENVTACGGSDGKINLLINGGQAPFDYLWGGPTGGFGNSDGNAFVIENLMQGSYSVTISDSSSDGCVFILPNVIVNGDAAIVELEYILDASCPGGSDGRIALDIIGSNPQILWSNGDTTELVTGLLAGDDYFVTITEQGCAITLGPFEVKEPEPIAATFEIEHVSCFEGADGRIDLSVVGGNGPYQYDWSNGSHFEDIFGLSAQVYSVTISDVNNCTVTVPSIFVKAPSLLEVDTVLWESVNCYLGRDGKIGVQATGGTFPYTYLWNNDLTGSEISFLGAGTYTVSVNDAAGCLTTQSFHLGQPDSLNLELIDRQDASCNGIDNGKIAIDVSGGTAPYHYLWNHGDSVATTCNLATGDYMVLVSDANGCEKKSLPISIAAPEMIDYEVDVNDAQCQGVDDGALIVMVNNGDAPFNYHWEDVPDDTPIRLDLAPDWYFLTITDTKGCEFYDSMLVDANQPMIPDIDPIAPACFGQNNGSISVSVLGGQVPYNFVWNLPSNGSDLENLLAGQYFGTITDGNNCQFVIDTITLENPPALQIFTESIEHNICFGGAAGSVDVTLVGGTSPLMTTWSTGTSGLGNIDLTAVPAGIHSIMVEDAHACIAELSFEILEPAPIHTTTDLFNIPECGIDPIDSVCLTVSGGVVPFTYHWSNLDTTACLVNAITGDYSVTVTDANGCTDVMMDIKVPDPIPSLDVELIENTLEFALCFGTSDGELSVKFTGGQSPYSYNWNHGVTGVSDGDTLTVNALESGVCRVTVVDANGCDAVSADFPIMGSSPLLLEVDSIFDIKCKGGQDGEIMVSASGGISPYTFEWLNEDSTFNAVAEDVEMLAVGDYFVTVTDQSGCTNMVESISIAEPLTSLTISGQDPMVNNVSCFEGADGAINILVTGGKTPYQFEWNSGHFTEDIQNLPAGLYNVTVTDAHVCKLITGPIEVLQPDAPLLISSETITDVICHADKNGAIHLSVNGGWTPYFYSWSNLSSTQDLEGIAGGVYDLTITDSEGCEFYDTFEVFEPDELEVEGMITNETSGQVDGEISLEVWGGVEPYEYLWSNQATTSTITGLAEGNYEVTVSDVNHCETTQVFTIDIKTKVFDSQLIENISIFPNPTTAVLFIDLALAQTTPFEITISNLLGQVVAKQTVINGQREHLVFDLEGQAAGTYFVQMLVEDQIVIVSRFVLVDK